MKAMAVCVLWPILAISQQLGVKYDGTVGPITMPEPPITKPSKTIDVDGDGVDEIQVWHMPNNSIYDHRCALLNPITNEMYILESVGGMSIEGEHYLFTIGKARDMEHAEYFMLESQAITVKDVATNTLLFSEPIGVGCHVFTRDYDGDGLDDYFVYYGSYQTLQNPQTTLGLKVIGSGGAYVQSPGNSLQISVVGSSLILEWQPVAEASGYRILWSADVNGPSYAQVGYVRNSTTFTHIGFADVEPRGFYKVIAVTADGHTGGIAGEGGR